MARVIAVLLLIALSFYALIDAARTSPADTPARISKPMWILLILILPIIGPAIWLYFRYQSLFTSTSPISASDLFHPRRREPSAPLAPDDDPEFLARLDAVNRRKAYEQRKAKEEAEKKMKEQSEKDEKDKKDEAQSEDQNTEGGDSDKPQTP